MSFSVIHTTPSGASVYYSGAQAHATGATGLGGVYRTAAEAGNWDSVSFLNAAAIEGNTLGTGNVSGNLNQVLFSPASVVGGGTPIGDIRGEETGYSLFGTTAVEGLKTEEVYTGALYAVYSADGVDKLTGKVGVGITNFASSGYYAGDFTTRDNHNFETDLTVDTGNLNLTGLGSGVYTIGETVTLQTSLIDRIGNSLDTVSSITDDSFVKSLKISIIDEDRNLIYGNYKTDYKNPSFTFTKQENIDLFGSFTKNFGVRFTVENQDGGTHDTDFLLYGNRLSINKIYVSASGGTFLDENPNNDYGPSTGDISNAADRTAALSGFSHRLINTSGSTGAINFNLTFDQSPNFTNYDNLLVFAHTGTSVFDTTTQNLLGTFPLTQLENQNIRIFPDDGIEEGESNFFKFVASSKIGFYDELFTVGPYTLEPVELGTDPILYNVGEQEIVSGNLSILGEEAGGLYALGASGSGDGQRITGPGGKPYLLSGDSTAETQDLQQVTDVGHRTSNSIVSSGDFISGVSGYYNYIGIGTTVPFDPFGGLEIRKSTASSPTFTVNPNSGNVAIGDTAGPPTAGSEGYIFKIDAKPIGVPTGSSGTKFIVGSGADKGVGIGTSIVPTGNTLEVVGIGTTVPSLTVGSGSGTAGVGIGTTYAPANKTLEVVGLGTTSASIVVGIGSTATATVGIGTSAVPTGNNTLEVVGIGSTEPSIVVGSGSGTAGVGIGTTEAPTGKTLEVVGLGTTSPSIVVGIGSTATATVGIGTSAAPTGNNTLEVVGIGSTEPSIVVGSGSGTAGVGIGTTEAPTGNTLEVVGLGTTSPSIVVGIGSTATATVGIGTSAAPTGKNTLEVVGIGSTVPSLVVGTGSGTAGVGIGTSEAPTANTLEVVGISATTPSIVVGSGTPTTTATVGIGTTQAPTGSNTLEVVSIGSTKPSLIVGSGSGAGVGIGTTQLSDTGNALEVISVGAVNPSIAVRAGVGTIAGFVGIGTSNPEFPLDASLIEKANIAAANSFIYSTGSAIFGGANHVISGDFDVIAGGGKANISGGTFNFIGGGTGVNVDHSSYSSSVGGFDNDIFSGSYSVIGGGRQNLISGKASESHSDNNAILGGQQNKIISAPYSFIGGGNSNLITGTSAIYSAILGGNNSHITNSQYGVILGGDNNKIKYANSALAAGNYSTVQSGHNGAFVLSDSRTAEYQSTGGNTLNLRFQSGVFVDTESGIYINGNPVVTGSSSSEGDTLQTVTDRGNTTTTSILSTGPHISGISGLFGDRVGIGLNNPEDFNSEGNRLVIGDGVGAEGLTIFSGPSHSASVLFADGTGGNSSYEGFIQYRHGDEGFRIGAGGGAKMFIGANNTVGIGTLAPNAELEIASSVPTLRLTDSDLTNHYSDIEKAGVYTYLYSRANASNGGFIFLGTAGSTDTEFMRIDTAGKVGIGSNAPAYKLDVAGDIQAKDSAVLAGIQQTAGYIFHDFGTGWGYKASSSPSRLGIFTDTAERITITSAGNVGIKTASPSETLHVFGTTRLGGRGYTGGASIEYASFSETNGGASTIVGNAVYAGNANNTFRKTRSDAGNYIQLNYNKGITFHTNVTGSASSTEYDINNHEQVRITTGGSVGIGTNNPTAQYDKTVHIEGQNPTFRAETTYSAGWAYSQYVSPETTWSVGIDNNDKYIIANSATLNSNVKFVIDDANGYVGIGNTSPAEKLLVSGGNIQAYGTGIFGLDGSDLIKVGHTAGAGVIDCLDDNLIIKTSSAERISLSPNGSESLTAISDGNVGIGTVTATTPGGTARLSLQASSVPLSWGVSASDFVYHRRLSAGKFQIVPHYGGNVGELQLAPYGENDTPVVIGAAAAVGGVKLDVRGNISGSGNFLGTGDGNRITNNGVPYLLSGDSGGGGGSLTLQDVTDNGSSTTQPITVDAITGTGDLSIIKSDPKIILYDNAGANTDPNGEIIFKEVAVTSGNFAVKYNGANDRLEFNSPQDGAYGQLTINRGFGNLVNQTVGVNTLTPKTNFHVVGSGNTQGGVVTVQNSNTSNGSYCGIQFINSTVNTPRSAIFAMRTGGAYDADLTFHTTTANELNSTDYSTGTERMRITHDGTVGIGTNDPETKLHVQFTGTNGLRLRSTDDDCYMYLSNSTANRNNIIYFGDNSSNFAGMIQYNHQYDYMAFRVDGGEKVRISAAGDVGIGTQAPSGKLHVENGASSQAFSTQADELLVESSSHGGISILTPNASRGHLYFNDDAFLRWVGSDDKLSINTSASSTRIAIAESAGDTTFGGDVGIGTDAPAKQLSVYKAGNASAQITGTNVAILTISDPNSHGQLNTYNDGTFRINSVEDAAGKQLVLSGSNVGIGTHTPSAKLEVSGSNTFRGVSAFYGSTTNELKALAFQFDSSYHGISDVLRFRQGGSTAGGVAFSAYDRAPTLFLTYNSTTPRVGIANSNPQFEVDVSGTIHGTSGNFENGITINGNPVVTGTSAFESDTLQTVTDEGNTTTNAIIIENTGGATDYAPLTVSGALNGTQALFRGTGIHSFIQFQNSTTNYGGMSSDGLTIGNNGADAYITQREAAKLYLMTDNEVAVTIDAERRVGMGTLTPKTILDVDGAVNHGIRIGSNNALIGEGGATGTQLIFWNGTSAYYGRNIAPFTHTVSNHFFRVGGSDQMAITSAGVGIGTATPAQELHVEFANTDTGFSNGAGGDWGSEGILIENTSSNANTMAMIQLRNGDADFHIAGIRQGTDDNDLGFFAEGSEKVRITNAGSVGIGTNSPDNTLHVRASAGSAKITSTAGGPNLYLQGASGNLSRIRWNSSSGNFAIRDDSNSSDRLSITSDGDIVAIDNKKFKGTTYTSSYIKFSDDTTVSANSDIIFDVNGSTELMRLEEGGKVGIGTDNPSHTLDVESADETVASFNSTDNKCAIALNDNDTTVYVSAENSKGAFGFQAGLHVKNLNIDTAGKVGIGTHSPSSNLHVTGSALIEGSVGDGVLNITNAAGSQNVRIDQNSIRTTTNNNLTLFSNGTSSQLVLKNGGNVGVGTNNPTTKLEVSGAVSDSLAAFRDGSDGVEIATRGSSRQQIDFLGSNTSAINAKGSLFINYDSDNGGSNDTITFTRNGVDEAGTVDMVITEGKVGIGTNAPSYELDVIGTTRSTYYIGGAYFEENASSSKIKFYPNGTVLVMDEDGELKPSEKENDTLVFGVSKRNFEQPIVLGAEPILVTGPIKVGDYIVTSNKQGHGQAMKEHKFGTVIAQAMENGDGESYNIKAMIRKM